MKCSQARTLLSGLTLSLAGLLSNLPALGAEPCLDAVLSHSSTAERACSDLVATLSYPLSHEGAAGAADAQALASAFNNRALARMQARLHGADLEGAATDLGEAIALTPSSWAIYLNRGNLQLASGNARAALADYERVLELAPEMSAAVSRNSVLAWRMLGNLPAAEQQLVQSARPVDPGSRTPRAPPAEPPQPSD